MRLPRVHGVIRRRLLVNFRIDPAVVQRLLPDPFQPKLHDGYAVGGICLIRLEGIRPKRVPEMFGLSSENAAHRFAITWRDEAGQHDGVYIPRRDSGSLLNQLAGGRIFPGEHHPARFDVVDTGERVRIDMESYDHAVKVHVDGAAGSELPTGSIFPSIEDASAFFESGSLGYSATSGGHKLDGVTLHTHGWEVRPLRIDSVSSSYFADETLFPRGTVNFDCALIMRNIDHDWEPSSPMYA